MSRQRRTGDNNDNNDLTSDAVPSPARNKENNSEKLANSCDKTDNLEDQNYDRKIHQDVHEPNRSFNSKPTTAYANIININNSTKIHVGAQYIYNLNKSESSSKVDVVEDDAIKSLKGSRNPLTTEDLKCVAHHINKGWKDTARALNLSDGEIEQFEIDHKKFGVREVVYQILLDWIQNDPTKATVGCLANILWNNDQKDAVQKWSEQFKNKQ